MKKIILASASKRRSEILKSCGIAHECVVSHVKEIESGNLTVRKIVLKNAVMKAEKVCELSRKEVIISADTLVVSGGKIIGKPRDAKHAKKMLLGFSGRSIKVYTGMCVINALTGKKAQAVDVSGIKVIKMDEKFVAEVFAHLGPYDKAGGFSIEGVGSMIFDDVTGSYFNILGLSMMKLRELFERVGLDILDFVKL
ncbi:MAG: septum formation protein Maf [Candidatus Omnitrophica bacterium]|nr:septum formation protein Maf [Candidatus Omnitrophota bacterium]